MHGNFTHENRETQPPSVAASCGSVGEGDEL
jgi:hypothetical protein